MRRTSRAVPVTGLALALVLAVAGQSGGSTAEPRQESPEPAIDALFPSYTDDLAEIQLAMEEQGLFSDFPGVFGALVLTEDDARLLVKYDRRAPRATVEEFLLRLASVPSTDEIQVVPQPANFNKRDALARAQAIASNPASWASGLGIADVVSVGFDPGREELTVRTSGTAPRQMPATLLAGVSTRIEGGVRGFVPQNRHQDDAPWTGGTRLFEAPGNVYRPPNGWVSSLLTSTDAACTMGFVWRKWGTNELMGSTAEHCYEMSGQSYWYNYGVQVGRRYYYSTARDTMLLRSPTISQFTPMVWVGSRTTGVRRWVVGAQAEPVFGGAVALSGGNSGLTVGTNVRWEVEASEEAGKGPLVGTSVTACRGGDSGGPWLTTLSGSGDVIAHGQHVGALVNGSGVITTCVYIPVTEISGSLAASIAVH